MVDVDKPYVLAGDLFWRAAAAGEGAAQVFAPGDDGVGERLFGGAAFAPQGVGYGPAGQCGRFACDFVGLVEAAARPAGPVQGHGDEEVHGGVGFFGQARVSDYACRRART